MTSKSPQQLYHLLPPRRKPKYNHRHMRGSTYVNKPVQEHFNTIPFKHVLMAIFILEDALSVWTNLGKHLLLDALCVPSIKTGTRRIMRLDELSFVVRLERRTTEDSSSRRIMRLVPVFILETYYSSNNKCLPKFVQTDNASSSIKTANVFC